MRKLNHIETLFFYDGPEIFLAVDQFGANYICLLVDENEETWRILCVPTSAARANSLLAGEIDLRSVFENREVDELYLVESGRGVVQDLSAIAINPNEIRDDWLPDSGFQLEYVDSVESQNARQVISSNLRIGHSPRVETLSRSIEGGRPFGVTVLAILATLAAVLAGVRTLQYLGIIPFTIDFFVGDFSFRAFNLAAALMWGLLTWIYIWLVRMLWNVQKEARLFLAAITVFNLILDFIVLVSGGSVEDIGASFLLNALILIYVMLPGTQQSFDIEQSHSPLPMVEPPIES